MSPKDGPLVWLNEKVKSPPFSREARLEAGFLLRSLQRGNKLSLPQSRPMRTVGSRCHELRINDAGATWCINYRTDEDAIVIVEIFNQKTARTPEAVKASAKRRLKEYDNA